MDIILRLVFPSLLARIRWLYEKRGYCLASPGPAPKGLETTGNAIFNGLWTYLGVPCVSLPLLRVNDMPMGVQLVGMRGDEGRLLRTAAWMDRTLSSSRA